MVMIDVRIPALAIGAAMALATAPATATTTVLDFSGDICGGPCANGLNIDGDYGSVTGTSLTWATRATPGDSVVSADFVRWWDASYGSLRGIAYSGSAGTVGEVTFSVGDGFELTLDSLDGAGWPNVDRSVGVRVYDLGYNILFDSTETFPGQGFITVNFGISSTTGLILQWGPDSFNGGIDNLTFTVRELQDPPGGVIPEPATWGLMIAGFGLVGLAARRRRPATV